MHDAVTLEGLGVPTAPIITTEFVEEAHLQRDALGLRALDPAIIEHPLSTISAAQIRERAEAAAVQCRAILLGTR
jgi:hypothetical protein